MEEKQLEREIKNYKAICEMLDVPKLIIDHPTILNLDGAFALTEKDLETAGEWIAEYEKKKQFPYRYLCSHEKQENQNIFRNRQCR